MQLVFTLIIAFLSSGSTISTVMKSRGNVLLQAPQDSWQWQNQIMFGNLQSAGRHAYLFLAVARAEHIAWTSMPAMDKVSCLPYAASNTTYQELPSQLACLELQPLRR